MISFLGSAVAGGGAVPQVVSNANPLPVTLSGGIGGLAVAGTIAAGAAVGAQFPVTVGGIDGGGLARQLLTDATGVLQVNATLAGGSITVAQGAGNTANPWAVGGANAAGATVTGNSVAMGARFDTTPPVIASGQKTDVQTDQRGQLKVSLVNATNIVAISSNAGTAITTGSITLMTTAFPYAWNGASWDPLSAPRTAFRLPSSLASNNAANIKTTAGRVFSISGISTIATVRWVKLFDTTGAPNPAAQNPLYIFPAQLAANGSFSFNLPAGGLYFPTGIGIALVANPADLDNTAIAAGDIVGLLVTFQ